MTGYDPSLGSKTLRVVSGVTAYTHLHSSITYHLVWHQVLEVPDLEHSLVCPMQCRMNDVIVNDVPKFLTKNPTPESHAFVVPDPEFPGKTLTLPFHLDGVTQEASA